MWVDGLCLDEVNWKPPGTYTLLMQIIAVPTVAWHALFFYFLGLNTCKLEYSVVKFGKMGEWQIMGPIKAECKWRGYATWWHLVKERGTKKLKKEEDT